MEGLALSRFCTKCPPRLATSSSTCSTFVRPSKSAALFSAIGGRGSVGQRYSVTLKIHASKKTFTSFDDMINNSKVPVLVDFYATWCGPCQLMTPILNEIGSSLKHKISVVKVDTEKYPQVASRYGIQALPTFVLFIDGKPVSFLEGAHPKDDLISHVTQKVNAQSANRAH